MNAPLPNSIATAIASVEHLSRIEAQTAENPSQKTHIYRLNAHDWWIARNLDEAVAHAAQETGICAEDVLDELYPPYKASELMLWALSVPVDGRPLPFKLALDRYLDRGGDVPARFATTQGVESR